MASNRERGEEKKRRKIIYLTKSAQERAAGVRACNPVKFETGQTLPPILKIVIHSGHVA